MAICPRVLTKKLHSCLPVAQSLHVACYVVEAAESRGLRDALVRAHPPQQSLYSVYCLARGTLGCKVLQHTVVLAWQCCCCCVDKEKICDFLLMPQSMVVKELKTIR